MVNVGNRWDTSDGCTTAYKSIYTIHSLGDNTLDMTNVQEYLELLIVGRKTMDLKIRFHIQKDVL